MIATAEYIEKPTHDAISMDAYFLWEKSGKPHGRDQEFWLSAERMLLNQIESLIQISQKEVKPISRQERKATSKARATSAPKKAKLTAKKASAIQKARKSSGKQGKKTTRVQGKKTV